MADPSKAQTTPVYQEVRRWWLLQKEQHPTLPGDIDSIRGIILDGIRATDVDANLPEDIRCGTGTKEGIPQGLIRGSASER